MIRPLLIAERPSARRYSDRALDGRAGDNLARWAEIPRPMGRSPVDRCALISGGGRFRVDAVNLVATTAKEARWSAAHARRCAMNLSPMLRGRQVVLLGRRVAAAFGLGFEPLTTLEPIKLVQGGKTRTLFDEVALYVIPHPSGRCREWNDEDFRRRFREWWHEVLFHPSRIDLASGRVVDLHDPRLNDDDLRAVLVALARECRFSGHTRIHYSVLQHQVLAAYLAGERARRAGRSWYRSTVLRWLVHDLHEGAGVRDLATPVKRFLGPDYRALARRLQTALLHVVEDIADASFSFETDDAWPDHAAALCEAHRLMPGSEWPRRLDVEAEDWWPRIRSWNPAWAETEGVELYLHLVRDWRSVDLDAVRNALEVQGSP